MDSEQQPSSSEGGDRSEKELMALAGRVAPLGLCALDRELRFVSINDRMAEIDERPPEEHLGRTLGEMLPHSISSLLEPICRLVLESGETAEHVEIQGPAVNDAICHWVVSVKPLPVGGDNGGCICLVVEDNTLRKQHEQELAERLGFQRLISTLSNRFVNIEPEKVDQQIEEGLKEVVEYLGSDRGTLFHIGESGQFQVTHSYSRSDLKPFAEDLFESPLPFYASVLLAGRTFRMESPDDLPPEAEEERRYCEETGLQSDLCIPLSAGGRTMGYISIDARKELRFPEELVEQMRLVGETFASALERQRADQEVRVLQQRLESENIYLREEISLEHTHDEIVGRSRAIKGILRQVEQVAATEATVLITGETGTGKELVARALHNLSDRRERVMVKVNCAALPSTLMESELFGRAEGAYTGALTSQAGRFELADASTIFLDEVGELPLELQAKLLRVLQDGRFERLGSTKTLTVDTRVIAATNRNLATEMREGRFREDLYYRLNVFPISVPPLRERREDIPPLVWAFVQDFSETMGKVIERIPRSVLERLQACNWPGNVRELRNVIERGMIISTGGALRVDLPVSLAAVGAAGQSLEEVERAHILAILEQCGWRVSGRGGAAETLNLNPSTLESRMRKHGIRRPNR